MEIEFDSAAASSSFIKHKTWFEEPNKTTKWNGYQGTLGVNDWSTPASSVVHQTDFKAVPIAVPISVPRANNIIPERVDFKRVEDREEKVKVQHLARRDAAFQIEQYRYVEDEDEDGADGADGMEDDSNKEARLSNSRMLKPIDPEKESRGANDPTTEPLELWFPDELDKDEIVKRRSHIKERMLLDGPFELNVVKLKKLVCEYDRVFLNNRLFEALNHQKAALDMKVGGIRMKKGCGGCCLYCGNVCTIHMHPGLMELKFGDGENECQDVGGIVCHDILDCVQLILEHEMIHMILDVFLKLKEAHGRNFKALIKGLFGHALCNHTIGAKRIGPKLTLEERIKITQDAEEKRQSYKPGTVIYVQMTEIKMLAAVLLRRQESLTIMHVDGKIVEKIPYHLTELFLEENDNVVSDLSELETHYTLFLDNKKQVKVGCNVQFSGPDGMLLTGETVGKKPLGALVKTNPLTVALLPFHTLVLV